jgi:hypothetical protein
MSQPTLNSTPLFQSTLRQWQAEWKAGRSDGSGVALAPRRLLGSGVHRVRQGRNARRPS